LKVSLVKSIAWILHATPSKKSEQNFLEVRQSCIDRNANACLSGGALPRPTACERYVADVHLIAKDGLKQMPFLPIE
jgi:hypothetical protein